MLKGQFFIRYNALFCRLIGELDGHSVEKIRLKVSELIQNYNINYLVLNCEELAFMDSSGIGFIIGRYNQLKESNGQVILCEMNNLIERIVSISGLTRIVTIKKKERDVELYLEGVNNG